MTKAAADKWMSSGLMKHTEASLGLLTTSHGLPLFKLLLLSLLAVRTTLPLG